MDRQDFGDAPIACVRVPALPLQAVLRAQRAQGFNELPVVVLDADKAQGQILFANRHARRQGVMPGQRYAAALALCPKLRTAILDPTAVADCVHELATLLRGFSPSVETSSAGEPGLFWLDAQGLGRLYPSLTAWVDELGRAVGASGFTATVVLGFSRAGTHVVARVCPPGQRVRFERPDDERVAMLRVALGALALPGELAAHLERLGLRTVADLVRLPRAGLRRRFGAEVAELHAELAGERCAPVVAALPDEVVRQALDLDEPGTDREGLLFVIKRLLTPCLARLEARGEVLIELELTLHLRAPAVQRTHPLTTRTVRPAAPTREVTSLLELVRLALESWELPSDVLRVGLMVRGQKASAAQLEMFVARPRRVAEAADRALSRLRALFGEDAVVSAELREGHLPEASFAWRRFPGFGSRGFAPAPAATKLNVSSAIPRLVRRLWRCPVPLPERPARAVDGWLVAGIAEGPVERVDGPYVLSGGWWRRELRRDYVFVTLRSGMRLWIFRDPARRRWFMHGRVE